MWSLLALTVLISLSGIYYMLDQNALIGNANSIAMNAAVSMEIYRQAIITHCANAGNPCNSVTTVTPSASDFIFGSNDATDIKNLQSRWTNYIDTAGTIYISPTTNNGAGTGSIMASVGVISQHSMMAGQAMKDANGVLYLFVPWGIANAGALDFNVTALTKLQDPATNKNIPGIVPGMPVWLAN